MRYRIPKPAEQTLPQAENLFKALLFPALLFASFLLTRPLTKSFGDATIPLWVYGVLLLLGLFNGVILIGMGVIAHEGIHRVLFRRLFWNDLIGGLLSALALFPFYSNREFHLTHHRYAHQPERDPEQPMHNRNFWVALTYGSVILLWLHYRILFVNLLRRFGDRPCRARMFKDLALISCAAVFYGVLVPAAGVNPLYSLLPTLLGLQLVFGYRALSDHYGLPAVERRVDKAGPISGIDVMAPDESPCSTRDQASGWVILTNPLLEWVWSHINYHEVHHRFPWLSHAHLKPVFEATRGELPYFVARGYTANLFRLARLPYYGSPDDVSDTIADPARLKVAQSANQHP